MSGISIKSSKEIELMRRAGQIVGSVLHDIKDMVGVGKTPLEIDAIAKKLIHDRGGLPAFLGYHGYPATVCISVNDALVHGIPNNIPFKAGDVVGIDLGAIVDGYYADAAITLAIPPVALDTKRLLENTEAALMEAIKHAQPGASIGLLSATIQAKLEEAGLGIVQDLTGHGIGKALHESPEIPNFYAGNPGPILRPGMTICLEPMASLGNPDLILDKTDGWTYRTRDGSNTAQFEHMILITDGNAEILTPTRPWPNA